MSFRNGLVFDSWWDNHRGHTCIFHPCNLGRNKSERHRTLWKNERRWHSCTAMQKFRWQARQLGSEGPQSRIPVCATPVQPVEWLGNTDLSQLWMPTVETRIQITNYLFSVEIRGRSVLNSYQFRNWKSSAHPCEATFESFGDYWRILQNDGQKDSQ